MNKKMKVVIIPLYAILGILVGCISFICETGHIFHMGTDIWRFKTGNDVDSSPVVSDGIVYVGSWDKYLYAVDTRTGLLKWKFHMQENS